MSLCLISPLQLGLFDIVNTPGVAADLSHIATPAKVQGYLPADDGLNKALAGAEIIVIPAGVPRKPGVCPFSLFCSLNRNLKLTHWLDDSRRLVQGNFY